MKKVLLVLVAVVMVSSVSFGQDVVPNITAGSKALLFTFGGLTTLAANNFSGGFGAKYFLSQTMAVRGGIQFSSSSSTIPANAVAPNTGIDGSGSGTTIGIAAAIEMHMGSGRVSPFVGAGVGFSTTSTESKNTVVGNPPNPANQSTTKNNLGGLNVGGVNYTGGTNISVYALAGFEFFLWKEVSLGAEYKLGFTSTSPKDQEVVTGTTTVTTKGTSSSTINVAAQGLFTLAVYLP